MGVIGLQAVVVTDDDQSAVTACLPALSGIADHAVKDGANGVPDVERKVDAVVGPPAAETERGADGRRGDGSTETVERIDQPQVHLHRQGVHRNLLEGVNLLGIPPLVETGRVDDRMTQVEIGPGEILIDDDLHILVRRIEGIDRHRGGQQLDLGAVRQRLHEKGVVSRLRQGEGGQV